MIMSDAKVFYVFVCCSKTLTLMFPSAGTWVTFGGQISDEVRRQIQHSAVTVSADLGSYYF